MSATFTKMICSSLPTTMNQTGLGWYQTGNQLPMHNRLNIRPPHFKGMRRQYKNSGYTLFKILNEYIDNVAKIAKHVDIQVRVSSTGMVESIAISDDCEKGFENINESGEKNPFNFAHMRPGQDDDDELSEFGIGMKAAAIAAGNLFTVYTNVNGVYHEVVCNFDEMESEPEIDDSYILKHNLIGIEEYRANHPFQCGSTIVLSELHPTLHEITSQDQIQKEFSDAISNAYSNYIRNGLNIRVNGIVVQEERDWFSDPTCQLFNINSKIFVLENQNCARFMYCIRTDKKTKNKIYKKYDTTKPKGQTRLKQISKKELDQLVLQGYKPSYLLKSDDTHAIEINSTITLYSDKFDGENPVEPPMNHVHAYKDNRKYGSTPLEYRNNGCHNYNCHKIELKSKKLGKELGMTFNKQFSLEMPNDLTRMIREIIKDEHNSDLNGDTSSKKNVDLCQRYLDEMEVVITTCNPRKLSTHHKNIREAALQVPEPEKVPEPVVLQVPEPVVHMPEPVVQMPEPVVQMPEPVLQVPEPVLQVPEPVVENQSESDDDSENSEQLEINDPYQPPNIVPDSVREVGPSVHESIVRGTGEKILEEWYKSGQYMTTFEETLDDMITSYQDGCRKDQAQDFLKFMTFEQKHNMLIHIMKKRHPLPEDRMLKGIELQRIYHEKFGTNAVVGL